MLIALYDDDHQTVGGLGDKLFLDSSTLTATSIAALAGIIMAPAFGALADRIGNAKVYMIGAAFMVIFAFPLFALLDTKNLFLASLAMSLGYGIGFGGMAGAQGAFLANLFPTRYRFSGIALAREFNGMLIAGPTPFIAAALVAMAGSAAAGGRLSDGLLPLDRHYAALARVAGKAK